MQYITRCPCGELLFKDSLDEAVVCKKCDAVWVPRPSNNDKQLELFQNLK